MGDCVKIATRERDIIERLREKSSLVMKTHVAILAYAANKLCIYKIAMCSRTHTSTAWQRPESRHGKKIDNKKKYNYR